ncbi:hypothetical protein [Rheinheimera sp.]|uniref:hypothetical protein n=1 Tax=Rheinheimera sp. TaxID=1869214 RepID=UPI00307E5551
MKTSVLTSLLLVSLLSACSTMRQYTMPEEANLLSGSGSLLVSEDKAEAYETIDINTLLSDYGFSDIPQLANTDLGSDKLKYQRNELQDRVIAASNQKCGMYLRVLTSSKAQTQLGWGGLATLLSGAAAVVTPATTAKALAAGSTVSNGILSQYNEAYFNNLAINVISSGITSQREGILQQINSKRQQSLVEYPVNRAIADAVQYHAVCNIISGLETAAVATRNMNSQPPAPAVDQDGQPQPTTSPAVIKIN